MARAESKASPAPAPAGRLGRAGVGGSTDFDVEREECRRWRLQRKIVGPQDAVPGLPAAPPIVRDVVRSPGQPLDAATRTLMGRRFGHDFSQVRVHTDARAAESARAVNALAYTVGRDVVFAQGQHAPGTEQGQKLLAHELTHAIQQSALASAAISSNAPIAIEPPDTAFERAAEEWATHPASSPEMPAPRRGIALQRAPDPQGEIEMPEDYVGSADKPADVLNAIVMVMSGTASAAAYGSGSANPFHPLHYIDRSVTRKEYVDLLWEWFRIANEWETDTTSKKNPNLQVGVTGPVARVRIAQAVAETASIVAGVGASGAAMDLALMRQYQTQLDALQDRAAREEKSEAAVAEVDRLLAVQRTPWGKIRSQWDSRKADFLAVAASPNNRLSGDQLFQIWYAFWTNRLDAAWVDQERVGKKVWAADPVAYADNMWKFQNGKRDALGKEYQEAADRHDTAFFMTMFNIKVLDWLQTRVDIAGDHLTFKDVDAKAIEIGEAYATWGWIQEIGVAAAGSYGEAPPAGATDIVEGEVTAQGTGSAARPADRPVAGFARDIEPSTQQPSGPPDRQVAGFGRDIEPSPPPPPGPPQRQVAGFGRDIEPATGSSPDPTIGFNRTPAPRNTTTEGGGAPHDGPGVNTQMPPARQMPMSPTRSGTAQVGSVTPAVSGQRQYQPTTAMAGKRRVGDEHESNIRPSTEAKHQEGRSRVQREQEAADLRNDLAREESLLGRVRQLASRIERIIKNLPSGVRKWLTIQGVDVQERYDRVLQEFSAADREEMETLRTQLRRELGIKGTELDDYILDELNRLDLLPSPPREE